MLYKLNLEHILFLDIETVPQQQHFSDLDETAQLLWEQKTQYQRKDEFTPEEFYDRAGIWAEFGKIVCISVGYFTLKGEHRNFRVTSFYGDEVKILKDFKQLLSDHFSNVKHLLCAHNGKEFDFPYIARRMIINGINLLGIPSPKEDMDGSMVKDVFYKENDLDRIVTYCELDVVTTAQVFLRLRNEELLEDDDIKKI